MIQFILNSRPVQTALPPGTTLLDFIRYEEDLPGTKIGCREGDCGACTVLEGSYENSRIAYKSIVSCLTPLGNAHGKHIVTIEGLNMDWLSPVQQAFADHNATQCGFCTPGFVVALTGHALSGNAGEESAAIASMSGNICRCTGYKSIERAAISISRMLAEKSPAQPLEWLVEQKFLPGYFLGIGEMLKELLGELEQMPLKTALGGKKTILGGGTDLMVQRPEKIAREHLNLFLDKPGMREILDEARQITIGASATASDIMHSEAIQSLIPDIPKHFRLISSEPIRNMGTIAGNFVNASPIADLVIYFLALDIQIIIADEASGLTRQVPARAFYHGYKKTDLRPEEHILRFLIRRPEREFLFNFEKVSKRTHLDIASVNGAMYMETDGGKIGVCRLSCGGVAPIPLYLEKTASFLEGKQISTDLIIAASSILDEEISPISDIRGNSEYKRLLARQLFFAHFAKLFPERTKELIHKAGTHSRRAL